MEFIIGTGLIAAGYFLNSSNENATNEKLNDPENIIDNNIQYVKPYSINYDTTYKSDIYTDSKEFLYNKISDAFVKSMNPNSNIINNIWRVTNDSLTLSKNNEYKNSLNKDINMIKKTYNNNIETMNNINFNNDLSDNDSVFSDNYSLPLVKHNKKKKI